MCTPTHISVHTPHTHESGKAAQPLVHPTHKLLHECVHHKGLSKARSHQRCLLVLPTCQADGNGDCKLFCGSSQETHDLERLEKDQQVRLVSGSTEPGLLQPRQWLIFLRKPLPGRCPLHPKHLGTLLGSHVTVSHLGTNEATNPSAGISLSSP